MLVQLIRRTDCRHRLVAILLTLVGLGVGILQSRSWAPPVFGSASGISTEATGSVYFDLALDEARQRAYGSDQRGGRLDVISLQTHEVISKLAIGSSPAGIDLRPDGKELAIALPETSEIAFLDPETLTVTSRIVPEGVSGQNRPWDVLYGRPGRLYAVGNGGSGGFDYLHVIDTATKAEVGRSGSIIRAAPRLAMPNDKTTLYIGESAFSPQQIYRFDISTDTPKLLGQGPHGPVQVQSLAVAPDGSRVYTSLGQVWSGDLTQQIGAFSARGTDIEYVDSRKQLYVSGGSSVSEVNIANYSIPRTRLVSGTVGAARALSNGSLLYVSTSSGLSVWDLLAKPQSYLPLVARVLPPTSTSTPAPTLTPSPTPPTVTDNFSNPASGWTVSEDGTAKLGYLNGEYQILLKQVGQMVIATRNLTATDFQLEVDARPAGTASGAYGLAFGLTNAGYYLYQIFDNGAYRLRRYDRAIDSFVTLVGPASSNAILPGSQINRLKVTRLGSLITLFVNGQQIGRLADSTYNQGSIGLVASSSATSYEARFDDFLLQALYLTPTTTATSTSTPTPTQTPISSPTPIFSPTPTLTPTSTPTIITVQANQAVAYQINPAHTGAITGTSLTTPLVKKWAVNLGGSISYPLIADGKVFVTVANSANYGTKIYALDGKTGQSVWGPVSFGGTYSWSNAAYDAGTLFVINFDGLLKAYDAGTGAAKWAHQLPGQYAFSSPPVALQGNVYVGGAGSGGTVYAVDSTDGTVRWTASVANGDQSSPALTDDGVFVSYSCPNVYKLSRTTGHRQWVYTSGCSGGGGKTSVFYRGSLYVRDGSSGYIFDGQTGKLSGGFQAGPVPAFAENRRFSVSDGSLYATDVASEVSLWSFTGTSRLTSAPLVVNQQVFVGSTSGILSAVNVVTGAQIWSDNVGASIPAPDEQNVSQPLTGLNVGEGLLVVPAGNLLVAYTTTGS